MKFTPTSARSGTQLLLDITPMVDVVFLLIIFFMTTAQFARITRAEVELPHETGEQKEESEEAGLIVNLLRDGSIIVNQDPMAFDDLADLVRNRLRDEEGGDPTQFKLMIRADRNAKTTQLNELLRFLEGLGIGQAKLATEVPG
jgi:biopolymer transport protein ExbD